MEKTTDRRPDFNLDFCYNKSLEEIEHYLNNGINYKSYSKLPGKLASGKASNILKKIKYNTDNYSIL